MKLPVVYFRISFRLDRGETWRVYEAEACEKKQISCMYTLNSNSCRAMVLRATLRRKHYAYPLVGLDGGLDEKRVSRAAAIE